MRNDRLPAPHGALVGRTLPAVGQPLDPFHRGHEPGQLLRRRDEFVGLVALVLRPVRGPHAVPLDLGGEQRVDRVEQVGRPHLADAVDEEPGPGLHAGQGQQP